MPNKNEKTDPKNHTSIPNGMSEIVDTSESDGVELIATRWCDNNIVTCLSTLSGCESIDMVKRWSSSQKQHIQVKRPNIIKLYNAHMGGCRST